MRYFSYFIILVIAAAIVAGFFIVGTPKEERLRRFDDRRLSDLQMIQSQVISFFQAKEKLPETLSALQDPTRGVVIPKDPETGAEYEYQVKAADTIELCATFALASIKDAIQLGKPIPAGPMDIRTVPYPGSVYYGPEAWAHGAGRTCFERKIDKDFFPPIEKPRKTD